MPRLPLVQLFIFDLNRIEEEARLQAKTRPPVLVPFSLSFNVVNPNFQRHNQMASSGKRGKPRSLKVKFPIVNSACSNRY
jgi:hypothetical protein